MIYEKLLKIQQELKCSKNQRNEFGKYNYRNCEDILEAVKPILKKINAVIILADELVTIGERYYIKATAKLVDVENGEKIENVAFAREEEEKKGMDSSQVTGASSSYARKYALNGLFAIDDVKDSDTTNTCGASFREKKSTPTLQETASAVSNTVCSKCGTAVSDKVASYSMSKFKAVYCMNCQKSL